MNKFLREMMTSLEMRMRRTKKKTLKTRRRGMKRRVADLRNKPCHSLV